MKRAVFFAIVFVAFLTNSGFTGNSNAYIKLNLSQPGGYLQAEKVICAAGGRVHHIFPPNEIICYLPSFADSLVERKLDCQILRANSKHGGNFDAGIGYKCWQVMLEDNDRGIGADYNPLSANTADNFVGNALKQIDDNQKATTTANKIVNNYMIGRIAVGVIFMESSGSAQNWSTWDMDMGFGSVVIGLDSLVNWAETHNVPLSFIYERHDSVMTLSEPISEPEIYPYEESENWHFLWMDTALYQLNVAAEWDGIYEYANRLRHDYIADWAFTMFMIRNVGVPGFAKHGEKGYTVLPDDGRTPPFAVCTYLYNGDNGWKTKFLVTQLALMVFGCGQEYSGGFYCQSIFNCNDALGYLNYQNDNCFYCASNQIPCKMRNIDEHVLCPYTLGQVGWVDSDGDGAPDPIDPNSDRWATIFPVVPGDLVRIFTVSGGFVNSIAATENNVACQFGTCGVVWDGHNYDNQQCVPTYYYATVNSGNPFNIYLHDGDTSVHPVITAIDAINDTLHWFLDSSWANVNLDIYQYDSDITWKKCLQWIIPGQVCAWWVECEPEEADTFFVHKTYADTILARLIWNKAYTPGETYDMDLSPIICDNCIAVFSGWRPDGGLARGDTLEFRTYLCGDANDDNAVNILDVIVLVDYKFKGGPPPANLLASDVNCDDSVNVLDIIKLINYLNKGGPPPCCGMCCDN